MRLNARILKNVTDVNSWQYDTQATLQEGQINEIYFQLVDLDKVASPDNSLALPAFPLRYMPQGSVISLQITFPALRSQSDDPGADQFTVAASQPFSDDPSIWKVTLASAQVPHSGSITMQLITDGNSQYFLLNNAIAVNLLDVGSC